jgi:hypothetical protein
MSRVLALLPIAFVFGGCYLAHERPADAGARRDVALPDAVLPDAFEPDAAPECTLRCEMPTTLASAALPVRPNRSLLEAIVLDPVVTPDAVYGVVLATPTDPHDETELSPWLFRADRATGVLSWLESPDGLRTHVALHAAELRVTGDALDMIALATTGPTDVGRDAIVARGEWSVSSMALTREEDALMAAPFDLVPTFEGDGTVFGARDLDIAAFANLDGLYGFVLRGDASPEFLRIVSLSDTGAVEPLSGAVLADGRIVIAGGGAASLRTEARAPFFAIGRIEDAPLVSQPVIGASHDPPPLVVAEGDGYALARHVTDDADVVSSAIHFLHVAPDGTSRGEVTLATTNGRRPFWMSLFAGTTHAGLAWLEHGASSLDALELRVVTPGVDRGCSTAGVAPLASIDMGITGIAAAAGDDGTVFVVTVLPRSGPIGPTVSVLAVPACAR